MFRLPYSSAPLSRLPSELLTKIFCLTIICPNPLRIDTTRVRERDEPSEDDEPRQPLPDYNPAMFTPTILRLSRSIYNELSDYFWKHNTFSFRRSALCQYHSPFRFTIGLSQRLKIRSILLTSFAGTSTCHRLAIGTRKSHTRNGPKKSCQNCNPRTFPDLSTLFPNAKLVTVDYGAHRDSRIVFEQLCKATVAQRGNQYLCTIGVGEAVLCNSSTARSATIVFEDRRLKQIWRELTAIPPHTLYRRACAEVAAMKRLSLRTTEMVLRLLDFYDHECDFLMLAGSSSEMRVPSDLRGEQREMSGVFLTALNWTLREYLRTRDSLFVRALEGGGIQMVAQTQRLQRALLEELGEE